MKKPNPAKTLLTARLGQITGARGEVLLIAVMGRADRWSWAWGRHSLLLLSLPNTATSTTGSSRKGPPLSTHTGFIALWHLWVAINSSFNTFHFPSSFLLYIVLSPLISPSTAYSQATFLSWSSALILHVPNRRPKQIIATIQMPASPCLQSVGVISLLHSLSQHSEADLPRISPHCHLWCKDDNTSASRRAQERKEKKNT